MCAVFLKLWVWPLIGSQVCFWWVLTRQTHQFVLISSGLKAKLNLDNLCLSCKGLLNLAIKVRCVCESLSAYTDSLCYGGQAKASDW